MAAKQASTIEVIAEDMRRNKTVHHLEDAVARVRAGEEIPDLVIVEWHLLAKLVDDRARVADPALDPMKYLELAYEQVGSAPGATILSVWNSFTDTVKTVDIRLTSLHFRTAMIDEAEGVQINVQIPDEKGEPKWVPFSICEVFTTRAGVLQHKALDLRAEADALDLRAELNEPLKGA